MIFSKIRLRYLSQPEKARGQKGRWLGANSWPGPGYSEGKITADDPRSRQEDLNLELRKTWIQEKARGRIGKTRRRRGRGKRSRENKTSSRKRKAARAKDTGENCGNRGPKSVRAGGPERLTFMRGILLNGCFQKCTLLEEELNLTWINIEKGERSLLHALRN